MKRRERKWTKVKLMEDPQQHPILALWDIPEVLKVIKKRGENGLHFNDMRYLRCRDYKKIKRPPKDWSIFSENTLRKMREYNDYTILQKDITKLCDIGFLRKRSRGYYTHVERPVMRYIRDISLSARNLVGSGEECDILASEAFELSEDVENECEHIFHKILEARASSFESKIRSFWNELESSELDIPQKIILRGELYPFTRYEGLKRLIKKECLITTEKGREAFDISPFKKRNAEKMRELIEITKKYSKELGAHAVKYAMGMYSYPNIFTEDYIAKKGKDFKDELAPYISRSQALLSEFAKPCYVVLAPRQ